MTRGEEIIIQSYDYGKYLLDTGFSTEEAALKCMRVAFIDGARWADEHPVSYDGKAMLYVNNKSHENGYKEAVNKVCNWLRVELDKEEELHYIHVHGFDKERREIFLEKLKKQ